jgi:hypothetical protein
MLEPMTESLTPVDLRVIDTFLRVQAQRLASDPEAAREILAEMFPPIPPLLEIVERGGKRVLVRK